MTMASPLAYDMIDLLKCSFILNYKHSMALYKHISIIASGQPAVSNQFFRGSHLLSSQLPGEHTGLLPHMAHSPC